MAPGIRAVAFVPPTALSTTVARGLLPDGRSASRRRRERRVEPRCSWPPWRRPTDLLLAATEDLLHQAVPPPRDAGLRWTWSTGSAPTGHAAVVSGAGPSVLVLLADDRDLTSYSPAGWAHLVLDVATDGVQSAVR